eukprot:1390074-Amphidinium_carterae.1
MLIPPLSMRFGRSPLTLCPLRFFYDPNFDERRKQKQNRLRPRKLWRLSRGLVYTRSNCRREDCV